VKIQAEVFWVVKPCRVVVGCQRFRRTLLPQDCILPKHYPASLIKLTLHLLKILVMCFKNRSSGMWRHAVMW